MVFSNHFNPSNLPKVGRDPPLTPQPRCRAFGSNRELGEGTHALSTRSLFPTTATTWGSAVMRLEEAFYSGRKRVGFRVDLPVMKAAPPPNIISY